MDINEALRIRGVGVGKKLKGDATANDVRAGKTFSNAASNENEGTLPIRSLVAQTITPGVNNITKQAGIYDGDITVVGDMNLSAQNIKSGVSIFGVTGNLVGKKAASGSLAADGTGKITISGLAFQPSFIFAEGYDVTTSNYYRKTYKISPRAADLNTIDYRVVSGNAPQASSSGAWTINPDGFVCVFGSSLANDSVSWYAIE